MQSLGQYAIKASLVAAAYFAPCQEVIVIVFLFWLADLVFGVLASKNRHAPRSSRRAPPASLPALLKPPQPFSKQRSCFEKSSPDRYLVGGMVVGLTAHAVRDMKCARIG